MAHYIDKSALVAEIKRRIKEHHSGYLVCLKDILSFLDTFEEKEIDLGRASMKKNYPPKGEFYMYPQYDEENNLVGFTTDYEGEGAYGKYCKIIATEETL